MRDIGSLEYDSIRQTTAAGAKFVIGTAKTYNPPVEQQTLLGNCDLTLPLLTAALRK